MGSLDGKVAIITGAGRLRGIGRAAALALAELGADLVVTGTGRDPQYYPEDEKAAGWRDIESTAEQVRAAGRRCVPLVANVTDSAAVQDTVEATLKEFGRIDILMNNSAFARGPDRVPLTELSEDVWRKVLDIKLTGSFLMSQAVVPSMIQQGPGGKYPEYLVHCRQKGQPEYGGLLYVEFRDPGLYPSPGHGVGRA